ncbi:MAG: energy-coupling factor transporter transmembrane component T family protein [Anaerolineales bacterium]
MSAIGLYQTRESWLHGLDPRVKFLFTLSTILLALLYQDLAFMTVLFVFQFALYLSAGLSFERWRATMLPLLPVSLLMLILRWVFYPSGPVWTNLGPIQLTFGGLAAGTAVALRILTLAESVVLWLATTSNQELIRSLVSMGLPYSWGLSFSLALRFLPDFFNTYRTIEQAQRARGLDFANASLLQQVNGRQPILIAMIISSLRKSEQMAIALEARALESPGIARTTYRPLSMDRIDWLALFIILISLLLLLMMRFEPLSAT